LIYYKEALMSGDRARVFWSGRSQAVRLPKDYRFEVDEVRIRRRGVAVILEPVAVDWSWLDALLGTGPLDEDAATAAREEPGAQDRPDLDTVF
jgi:antitoxin VapB